MTSPHQNMFPQQFRYSYFGTELHYGYTTCKIVDYNKDELVQSEKLFSKIVLAAKYMHETKQDEMSRYTFKMKLMREVIRDRNHSRSSVQAVFYFIDYLLRLPHDLSKKLAETIRPIIEKEANEMVQFNNENPSPTLAEIFALKHDEGKLEGKIEGKLEGIEEERRNITRTLLNSNMSIESVAEITKLTLAEVEEIKRCL